ncbi:hypothetical protein C8R47DRAFT_1225473 [Mycena vitilis]|nr:hypothetical protein C8R47DRAFT_1225473 [Mycena vitilis]
MALIYSSDDELKKIELLVYNEWPSKDASEDAEWSFIAQRVGVLLKGRPIASRMLFDKTKPQTSPPSRPELTTQLQPSASYAAHRSTSEHARLRGIIGEHVYFRPSVEIRRCHAIVRRRELAVFPVACPKHKRAPQHIRQ